MRLPLVGRGRRAGRRVTVAFAELRGAEALLVREKDLRAQHFAPKPRLSGSEWADRYYRTSTDSSAIAGQWQCLPYQREIIDVITAREYRTVVVKGASQTTGKTACCIVIPLGYNIDLRPGPALVVEPDLEMAKAISADRIDVMFRDVPRLRGKKKQETGRREKDDRMLFKAGPGWRITMVGSRSASGLSMRPIRDAYWDEPDRALASAGREGDVGQLIGARQTTFQGTRVLVLCGSPTIEGESRIDEEYQLGDQRRWMVRCPHCDHEQTLEWGGPDEKFGVKWDKDADGKHLPLTAYYCCAGCGGVIDEKHKTAMNDSGRWVPLHPGRSTASFELSALPSPFVSWGELAEEWLKCQGNPEKVKAFKNTRLAKTYSPPGERYEATETPRVDYGKDDEGYPIVPMGAAILTLSGDVQADRIEGLVCAWAAGEECYHLANYRLYGDIEKPEVWQRLEALRTRVWQHASGKTLRIQMTAVDTSAYTKFVADYVRPLERRGVIGVKGSSELVHEIVRNPGKRKSEKHRIRVWMVGTIAAKDTFFARLLRIPDPGPGHQHFGAQIDATFLQQLGNERRVPIRKGTSATKSDHEPPT